MLIYKKNGSDLVSAANYAKTVNLTGVVQGSGSFNSSGVCAINTTNINNGRTVIAQYNQTSNVAGHYHICTFNTQYSNTICLELFYGMHFNFRVDLGYRKQNPTTQQTAPSTGLLTNVRASMQVFSGNWHSYTDATNGYNADTFKVVMASNTASNETQIWVLNCPLYSFCVCKWTSSGELLNSLVMDTTNSIAAYNPPAGWCYANLPSPCLPVVNSNNVTEYQPTVRFVNVTPTTGVFS